MKPNWRTASKSVREQIERLLAEPYRMTDGRMSTAYSWKEAADLAWSAQCDIEAPSTPATEKIAELRAAQDFRELNRLYMLQGIDREAEQETRNVLRWSGMRKFAAEPSAAEHRAKALAAAAAQVREAEIEARAMAIVAEQHRSVLERARRQARKEAEGTHD